MTRRPGRASGVSRLPTRNASERAQMAMRREPAAARAASDARAPREPSKRDTAPWRDELAVMNARLAVQDMALRALVQSHPCPADVLEAWQQLRADKVVAAYAPKADTPARAWLTGAAQALAEDWTTELADAAACPPATQCANATEPGDAGA